MITTTMIENSVVALLNAKYPDADIFRRNATQTSDKPTFVVNVEMQATTENRDYQKKDLEIIVQYFEDDKIEFNRNLNDVRDVLQSEIFINSMPILDIAKNVVKYILVKSGSVTVIDDILSIRMISDFTDDVVVTNPTYDLMGVLHLQKEC